MSEKETSVSGVKRFRIQWNEGVCKEDSNGEWVRYADCKTLQSRLRAIKRSINELEKFAKQEELPFVSRKDSLYRGILSLLNIKERESE